MITPLPRFRNIDSQSNLSFHSNDLSRMGPPRSILGQFLVCLLRSEEDSTNLLCCFENTLDRARKCKHTSTDLKSTLSSMDKIERSFFFASHLCLASFSVILTFRIETNETTLSFLVWHRN